MGIRLFRGFDVLWIQLFDVMSISTFTLNLTFRKGKHVHIFDRCQNVRQVVKVEIINKFTCACSRLNYNIFCRAS